MGLTAIALLGYIAWFLIILGMIPILRGGLILSGKKQVNSFDPTGVDVSAYSQRLCRVHANCYESFPFIGGLMLFAIATDLTAITDQFAMMMLAARILQSIVHLVSTSIFAVQVRFVFFLIQYVIAIYWLIQFILSMS